MKPLHKIVIPRIAASWEKVADYLECELESKQLIRKQKHDDSLVDLLKDRLCSDRVSPKSWTVLINTLKEIKHRRATTEETIIRTDLCRHKCTLG